MKITRGTCEHGKSWAIADDDNIWFSTPCAECEGRLARITPQSRARVVKTLRSSADAAWGMDIQQDFADLVPALA